MLVRCSRGSEARDLIHVVPVRHDAVLDRVLQHQYTALGLRLVTNVRVLLVHANHDDAGELGAAMISETIPSGCCG